ncbi:MAG: HAD family hydrolase [Phycisphaerales bacterium]
MKLLLFDIDGTLLLTNGASMRAMTRAGQICFGPAFSFDKIITAGGLDPLLYQHAMSLAQLPDADLHHSRFRDTYLLELQRELLAFAHDITVMPGISTLLHDLHHHHARHAHLGIVSGNYRDAAAIKLHAANIDPSLFPITAFGDDGPSRPALVQHAIAQHTAQHGNHLHPRDIIVIGDTPHDVACAHAHGCFALAVATGPYNLAALQSAGADLALPNLADPAPLLNLLN